MAILLIIIANIIWGVTPLYFFFLKESLPAHVIFMQVASSCTILLLFKWRTLSFLLLRNHVLTALLLGTNWICYYLAIRYSRTTEASLGYLLMPFLTILCGVFFLNERIKKKQILPLVISGLGFLLLLLKGNQFPFLGILIAASFTLYTIVHKQKGNRDPFLSMLHETILMMPFIALTLSTSNLTFKIIQYDIIALFPLGLIVVIPLSLYLIAIKSLSLIQVGMSQFISPLLIMILSLYVYNEKINTHVLLAYVIIAVGAITLTLYSVEKK